jgi:hypothetical protein
VKTGMKDQETMSAGGRGGFELKERLLAIQRRKLATGGRTPAIEAVRQRLMDERQGERGC